MVAGCLGGLALGLLLIPLRSLTSASNLAFFFIAFTIAIAELGGRSAALVTAVVSALAHNFFLTEPYLTLTITKPEDVFAFIALTVCGLIAAAFGRRRERLSDLADRAGGELEVVERLVKGLRSRTPLDQVLNDLRASFGLSAIVLRDGEGRILAQAASGSAPAKAPDTQLAPDTLLPADESRLRFGERGLRLPADGGRLTVRGDGGTVSLDLWEGDEQGFGVLEARTLTIATAVLGLELARRRVP